jgi:hypothetical protein
MAAINPLNYCRHAGSAGVPPTSLSVQDEHDCDSYDSIVCDPQAAYVPRKAEESILYGVVAENLETFLARQQQRERTVPRFVEREFREFLNCGIHAYGFLRVH